MGFYGTYSAAAPGSTGTSCHPAEFFNFSCTVPWYVDLRSSPTMRAVRTGKADNYNPDDNPQIFRTTEQQQQNFVV